MKTQSKRKFNLRNSKQPLYIAAKFRNEFTEEKAAGIVVDAISHHLHNSEERAQLQETVFKCLIMELNHYKTNCKDLSEQNFKMFSEIQELKDKLEKRVKRTINRKK